VGHDPEWNPDLAETLLEFHAQVFRVGKVGMKLPDELQFIENARKPQKTTDARLDGKLCVITGATSGVGYEAAKCLARGGARLVLVCRNPEKASAVQQELKEKFGADIDFVITDFSKLRDIRNAAETILARHTRIDVLINNAGVHFTHRTKTVDGFETVFAVNHLAPFLFTNLLLEKLEESAPARIIQINSQGHRFGGLDLNDLDWENRRYNGYKAYGAAKTAQLLTTWEFSDRLKGRGVTINAMHPGEVRTNIGMNNGWMYRAYQRYFLRWVLKDPVISGEAIYYLAAAPEMEAITGKYFNRTNEEKPTRQAIDRTLGKQIWKVSEQMVDLKKRKLPISFC
jgi:NAD(P)-dependent dehydrogenase (short-subunit alcohol dehydrogenase family)